MVTKTWKWTNTWGHHGCGRWICAQRTDTRGNFSPQTTSQNTLPICLDHLLISGQLCEMDTDPYRVWAGIWASLLQQLNLYSLTHLSSCHPWKWSESESRSVVFYSATSWTILYSPWNSPGQNTGVGSLSLLQGIFLTQGLNPGLPHCRWILYQLSQGKPRNTGVGSLCLLQRIFLTQELNWGFLHCRRILYQLSYQGSPATLEHLPIFWCIFFWWLLYVCVYIWGYKSLPGQYKFKHLFLNGTVSLNDFT